MTITPKYAVNQIVRHKFSKTHKNDKGCIAMEVLYIHTETCSAGTQIFYNVRLFYTVTEGYGDKKLVTDIAYSTDEHARGLRFREDELIECPQEVIDVLVTRV
jgi:hypothetical protein